ncbi:FecR/PupR family sigma factor regulator [Sphingobium sp. SCG-1]|uniref:FecR/PupR family sigma factor regulator n=1 Tax=Sphingobium sp. SCG-1 TaxID=2072936 RepID=UPI001CB90E54|nr:DUF4880 domain-containing protein [Sphingobium sp. SCG-1]
MLESNGRNWSEIEEEAARLLVKLRSDADEDEKARIYGWIEASPAHAVAFARVEAAWDGAEALKSSDRLVDLQDNTLAPIKRTKANTRSFMIGGALAASMLLAGVGATAKITGSDFGFSSPSEDSEQCKAKASKK